MLVPLSSISSCLRLTDTPAGAAGAPNLDLLLGMGCFCQCYAQESVQNLLKTTAYVSGIFNNDTSMHICIGRSIYLYDVCVFTVNICIYICIFIYTLDRSTHWPPRHPRHLHRVAVIQGWNLKHWSKRWQELKIDDDMKEEINLKSYHIHMTCILSLP